MIVLRVLSWILTRENIYGAVADSGDFRGAWPKAPIAQSSLPPTHMGSVEFSRRSGE